MEISPVNAIESTVETYVGAVNLDRYQIVHTHPRCFDGSLECLHQEFCLVLWRRARFAGCRIEAEMTSYIKRIAYQDGFAERCISGGGRGPLQDDMLSVLSRTENAGCEEHYDQSDAGEFHELPPY